MQNDKNLIEQFEKEIWLYIDNDLTPERMDFWDNQIQNNLVLKQKYEEIKKFLLDYDTFPSETLESSRFNTMLTKATEKERLFLKLKKLFHFDNNPEPLFPKLAFVTSLTIAAIIMLLLSQKPNPVKDISTGLFEWEDKTTTAEIQNIENSISLIGNDNLKYYILYKTMTDEWDNSIYIIQNSINNLNEEMDEKSL